MATLFIVYSFVLFFFGVRLRGLCFAFALPWVDVERLPFFSDFEAEDFLFGVVGFSGLRFDFSCR